MISAITLTQWIGAIGVGLFYPMANWRAFVSRRPVGLSFLAFAVLAVGVAGYTALGFLLGTYIFAGLNAVSLVFEAFLLGLMWFWSSGLRCRERVLGLSVLAVGFALLMAINLNF